MKLKLNNKTFIGKYNKNRKLIIELDNDSDKLFFKKWQNEVEKSMCKEYCVRDVEFTKLDEHGILKSCFPILSMNEDSVELVYDFYKVQIEEFKIKNKNIMNESVKVTIIQENKDWPITKFVVFVKTTPEFINEPKEMIFDEQKVEYISQQIKEEFCRFLTKNDSQSFEETLIGKEVTINGEDRYFVVAETNDEICLRSRIDGKLAVFERKKISLFDVKSDLLRKKQ
jgi:hypothetical protein